MPLLRAHRLVNVAATIYMFAVLLGQGLLVVAAAIFTATMVDGAINRDHAHRLSTRKWVTHSIFTGPLVGIAVGATVGLLVDVLTGFAGVPPPIGSQLSRWVGVDAYSVLLAGGGLVAALIHLMMDAGTDQGIYLDGGRRIAYAHYPTKNGPYNGVFIGASAAIIIETLPVLLGPSVADFVMSPTGTISVLACIALSGVSVIRIARKSFSLRIKPPVASVAAPWRPAATASHAISTASKIRVEFAPGFDEVEMPEFDEDIEINPFKLLDPGESLAVDVSNLVRRCGKGCPGCSSGPTWRLLKLIDCKKEWETTAVPSSKFLAAADASLRYHVDDLSTFEALLKAQMVILTPARDSADSFIIDWANERQGVVLSRDVKMREKYGQKYSCLTDEERFIQFAVYSDADREIRYVRKRRHQVADQRQPLNSQMASNARPQPQRTIAPGPSTVPLTVNCIQCGAVLNSTQQICVHCGAAQCVWV